MIGPVSAVKEFTAWKQSNAAGAGSFCRVYYRTSTWYRSGTRKRNWDAPLPYTMRMGNVDNTYGTSQTCSASGQPFYTTLVHSRWNNLNALTSNRAASTFVERAQGIAQASMGETLGEWDDSLRMIVARFGQLAAAARNLRRGHPRAAARALSLTRDSWSKSHLQKAKSFGEQWLEFHLGWAPLLSDIYNGLKVFDREPFPRRAYGFAQSRDGYIDRTDFGTAKSTTTVNYHVGYGVRGDVVVTNPNVALLASSGLANPISVAWALVPYSFVVDWFVNVSELFGLYDGLLGCHTVKTSYTTLRQSDSLEEFFDRVNTTVPWKLSTGIAGHGAYCNRSLGLPPVHFTYPSSPRFSWQRGATSVALLLQYLK